MAMITSSAPYSGKQEDEIVPYNTIFWVGGFVEMEGMYPLEELSNIRVQVKSYVFPYHSSANLVPTGRFHHVGDNVKIGEENPF
jgi:hypothetical protein